VHRLYPCTWLLACERRNNGLTAFTSQNYLERFFSTAALPLFSSVVTPTPSIPTLPVLLRAYLLVSTRAFLVDTFHSLSLVPLADLFNHEQETVHNAHFASDHWVCDECGQFSHCEHDGSVDGREVRAAEDDEDDGTCEMVAISPIEAGEEVFNHYGPRLSNAKLAVHYGFSLEVNDHDGISFALSDCVVALEAVEPSRCLTVDQLSTTLSALIATPEIERCFEVDHPLIADYSASALDAAAPSFLSLDADARLSPALWLLVACVSLSKATIPLTDLGELADLSRAASRFADPAEDDGEKSFADVDLLYAGAFDRATSIVKELVSHRLKSQREPGLAASALLDIADVSASFYLHTSRLPSGADSFVLATVPENDRSFHPPCRQNTRVRADTT
jgi:hypothetical protein